MNKRSDESFFFALIAIWLLIKFVLSKYLSQSQRHTDLILNDEISADFSTGLITANRTAANNLEVVNQNQATSQVDYNIELTVILI